MSVQKHKVFWKVMDEVLPDGTQKLSSKCLTDEEAIEVSNKFHRLQDIEEKVRFVYNTTGPLDLFVLRQREVKGNIYSYGFHRDDWQQDWRSLNLLGNTLTELLIIDRYKRLIENGIEKRLSNFEDEPRRKRLLIEHEIKELDRIKQQKEAIVNENQEDNLELYDSQRSWLIGYDSFARDIIPDYSQFYLTVRTCESLALGVLACFARHILLPEELDKLNGKHKEVEQQAQDEKIHSQKEISGFIGKLKKDKNQPILPASLDELFVNEEAAISAYNILMELEIIDSDFNYIGKSKGVFCIWFDEIRRARPHLRKSLLKKTFNDIVHAQLIRDKFKLSSFADSNFRLDHKRAKDEYQSRILALASAIKL